MGISAGGSLVGGQRYRGLGAIDANVDVAGAGDFEFLNAGDGADAGDDLLGNLARSLAQLAGQFEGDGERILAKLDFRRLLDDDICDSSW